MIRGQVRNPWGTRRVHILGRRRIVIFAAAFALAGLGVWGGMAVGGGRANNSEPAVAGGGAVDTEPAHGTMSPPLRPRLPEPARSGLLAERMPARNSAPAEPPPKIRTYRVQPGDTLSEIAGRFGVRVETILWANSLRSPDRLEVGQELRIPARDGVLHRVVEGDTMWDLARKYGVNTDDIVQANPDVEPGAVGVGDWLLIPGARPLSPSRPRGETTPPSGQGPGAGGGGPAGPAPERSESPGAAGKFGLWPLSGRITSGFGWRINPVTRRRSFHDGVDIAVPVGTPVRAVADGTVVYSGWLGGWGRTVKIDHGNGIVTRYSHLQTTLVQPGARVRAGQEIALSGNTGVSTGPHLDFGVYRGEEPLNPLPWLP